MWQILHRSSKFFFSFYSNASRLLRCLSTEIGRKLSSALRNESALGKNKNQELQSFILLLKDHKLGTQYDVHSSCLNFLVSYS